METTMLSRDEAIKNLMWSSGGTGFGVCSVAASMLWDMQRPKPGQPDWISIVTIQGKPEDYTDEELNKLVEFSKRRTAAYDKMFGYRMGANLIVIAKEKCAVSGKIGWLRKRMSWTMGPFYSDTLDEAIEIMD